MKTKETETYYERNKDRMKQNNKIYYKNNKKKVLEYRKRKHKENRNYELQRDKNRYEKNRLEVCKKAKKYRQENKDKIRAYFRDLHHKTKEPYIRSKTYHLFKDLRVKCEQCGSKDNLQFHHLKPYRFDNFVVLCKVCHLKEHGKERVL